MALNKEQLRAGALRYRSKTRQIHVKGLADPDTGDDTVLVRGLSAVEWDAHQAAARMMGENGEVEGIDESNISAKLAVRVIVDDQARRVLEDSDAGWFGESSPSDVAEIVNAALEISGMAAGGTAASEETKGNSEPAPSGGSSAESPESTEQPRPSSSPVSTLAAV